jgi:hypothetical protein
MCGFDRAEIFHRRLIIVRTVRPNWIGVICSVFFAISSLASRGSFCATQPALNVDGHLAAFALRCH